jgi:small-conductance mechanosensitive channel
VAAGLIPFLAWSPGDFVEDVIKFPLGLGTQRSAAETPTLGSVLIRLLPSWRAPLTVGLVCLVLAVFVFVLVRWPPTTASPAARDAGIVFLTAILLAPSARFGYVVYPINLFVWAWVLREAKASAPSAPGRGTGTKSEG